MMPSKINVERDKYDHYIYRPEFEGCQVQNDSLEETIANIKETVELYLETLLENKALVKQILKQLFCEIK